MNIIVQRANQDFGPYPISLIEQYIAQGSLLPHDLARKEGEPVSSSLPLGKLLAQCGGMNPLAGNPFQAAIQNMKSFDIRLLFPWGTIRSLSWFNDRRLIYLATVGLAPAFALMLAPGIWAGYWAIALYFSALWALFFFYLFRTPQVQLRICFLCFGFTAIISISLLLMLHHIWPWNALIAMAASESFLPRLFGMFFGVGVNEELCKAAILFWLVKRPGVQFVPQTAVFYGMISGLGFGIYEGVHYQMNINREAGVDGAYLLNIARLTSLPFLHAVWTGIAAYFIGFAALHPRKRYGLWVISIAVPALFHAVYNTFGWGFIGLGSALLSVVLLNTYLANVQQMQRQLAAP
ncbi:PrsW family glutamic-type intramembrane protease [Prosthecobacter sp.]|uniref:PrsW family glutamic-type intramembrane protease n=1 Tax=Prosthecobacter sp. TaxID=1965333 RepID=UPI003783BC1D